MVYLLLVLLGLCLGSFINALVWRLHEQWSEKYDDDGELRKVTLKRTARLRELSVTKGRSMCAHCGHQLAARDLIPLVSWAMLGGRCRYCKKPYDDTPLAELLLPFLLIVSFVWWPVAVGGWGGIEFTQFGLWALILTCLVALIIYDARWYLLPDRIVLPLTVLAGAFVGLEALQSSSLWTLLWSALGAITIGGLFWVLHTVSKGAWIGGGDVKLGVSLGLLAGSPLLACLLIFLASLFAMILMLPGMLRRDLGMKSKIPFGPFLIAAAFVVFLWGEPILSGYEQLLFTI